MIFSEFQDLKNEIGVNFGLDSSLTVSGYGGKCAVNDYIALKLSVVSPQYPRDQIIEIYPEKTNSAFAYLVTCAGTKFEFGKAGELIAAAYLEDIKKTDLLNQEVRSDYVLNFDYLVIQIFESSNYLRKYRQGSGLWGGFVHVEDLKSKPLNYQSTATSIKAYEEIIIDTPELQDVLWRSIQHSSPLERYLKLYHLIELIFDLDLVNDIRSLGPDLNGVAKLLNEYSGNKELPRIVRIARKYCNDVAKYESFLTKAFQDKKYHSKIIEILFDYSKDGNPYEDQIDRFKATLANGFSVNELSNNKLNPSLDHLSKLSAYLIYRVRCSIAHSRIGEYILTQTDEEFVANVAEPLLRSLLIEIYN